MVNRKNSSELPFAFTVEAHQVPRMQGYLQGLVLSLWALTELEETSWNQASQALTLAPSSLSSYLSPTPPPAFSLEVARSLVLMLARLAQQHQEILRRAITLLEQMHEQRKDPRKTALLGTYLEKFEARYHEQCQALGLAVPVSLQGPAFKFLVDLLFCSTPLGSRWLWSALMAKA